jgi:hypothetical protein
VQKVSEDADAAKRENKELRKEADRLREDLEMTNR